MSEADAALGAVVVFEKALAGESLLQWYCRATLGVVTGEGLAVYECTGHESTYDRHVYPWAGIGEFAAGHHCLLLDVSDDECARIRSTCEACVRAKLQYSTYDMLLSFLPFRPFGGPVDLPIFQVGSVRNVQAVVLILRECLAPSGSVLGVVLRTVNSRTVSPTELYHLVQPHTTPFSPPGHAWRR